MESFLPELSEGALGKSKVGGHLLAELQSFQHLVWQNYGTPPSGMGVG